MNETLPHGAATCRNCGAALAGEWCATCGQERFLVSGSLWRTVLRQWARVRHTIIALLLHPGELTVEYAEGKRVRAIAPWRLTFNIVAIFLALSFVTDFHVATFSQYDPSGSLHAAIAAAARHANLGEAAFVERADRRFGVIFTLLVVVIVGLTSLLAALTHWHRRFDVHVVFALHVTAWGNLLDVVYQLGARALGLGTFVTSSEPAVVRGGLAWILLFEAITFAYVLAALRRVYADGWLGGSAKAVVIIAARLVCANAMVFLATWLAIQTI